MGNPNVLHYISLSPIVITFCAFVHRLDLSLADMYVVCIIQLHTLVQCIDTSISGHSHIIYRP